AGKQLLAKDSTTDDLPQPPPSQPPVPAANPARPPHPGFAWQRGDAAMRRCGDVRRRRDRRRRHRRPAGLRAPLAGLVGGAANASSSATPPPSAPPPGGPLPPAAPPPPPGTSPAVGTWDSQAVGNAAIIVGVGARIGVPVRGWIIAGATRDPGILPDQPP